jgi:hypothetical protein
MMIFRETFFRPPELRRQPWTIPATLYNRTHLLFSQANSQTKSVFIPIRTMQYLAIIDAEEIAFIDSEGGYRYQAGLLGGRVIQAAWRDFRPQQRDSLSDPVSCNMVYYVAQAEQVMKRLFGEFSLALEQLEQRRGPSGPRLQTAQIIPWRRKGTG